MRSLIIILFLFISVFASAQNRVGLVHPRVLGQPTDTTQFGVILLDTVTKAGNWFTLNETDFEVSGGELRLRFQTDSVFVQGDSLCAITMGDTICVYQDSVYITADSFCIIQMGDTTCVEFTPGVGETTLYNGDGSLLTNRTVSLNNKSLTFDQGGISGKMYFNQIGIFPFLTIDGEVIANNTSSLFQLVHSGSGDMFMNFNGAAAEDYAFGVDKSADALVIAEGTDVDGAGDQMMVFYSTGDSIVSVEDHQFDAGILDASGDIGSSGQVLTSTGTGTNWETATGGAAISDLTPATATNTINNDGWEQEWQWDGLLGGAGLKLTSTNTGAIGSTQKLFEAALTGVNGTAGQETFAGYFSNTHSGSTSTNYGIRALATGGTTNYGIYTSTSGGSTGVGLRSFCSDNSHTAIYGTALGNSAYGVYGESTGSLGIGVFGSTSNAAGTGVRAFASTGGLPMLAQNSGVNANDIVTVAKIERLSATGGNADGAGGSILFSLETGTNATQQTANEVVSKWTTAANATRTSQMYLTGVNSATTNTIIYFEGDKRTRFNGRAEMQQGADVASVAGAIALGYDGNVFEITGTNTITLISNLGFQNGTEVTLIFTSTATLNDGVANSGTDIGMELNGNANLVASADDVIKLVLCEIGGTQRWRESGRSIN